MLCRIPLQQEGTTETFSDTQNQKGITTTRPMGKELVKELMQGEGE